MHASSEYSPSKEVNGYYPITSLEKSALPLYHFFSADRENKAKNIHDLHKKEGWSIKGRGATYFRQSRERRSPVVFQPGDWDGLHATNLTTCEFEDSDSRTNPFEGEGNDANPQTPMGLIPNFDNHYIEGLNNGPKYSNRVLNYFYTRRLKRRQWASPQNYRVINYEAHILVKDDGRLRPKLMYGPMCKLNWKEVLGKIPIDLKMKDQNAIKHFFINISTNFS